MFDRSDQSSTGPDITALSALEHFDTTLASYYDEKTPIIFENVQGLPSPLGSMDHLRLLRLRPFVRLRPVLHRRESFFTAAKVWSKLTTLKLEVHVRHGLRPAVSARVPDARDATLRAGKASSYSKGTWHGVIEGLKQSNRQSRPFAISDNSRLIHRGRENVHVLPIPSP